MPVVLEDLGKGHNISRSTWRNRITRVFRVTQLTMAPEYQIMEALAQPEIPQYLEPYPFSPTPEFPAYETCRVVDQVGEPDGANAVLVRVVYDNDFGSLSSTPTTEPAFGNNDGPEVKQVSYSVREILTRVDTGDQVMNLTPPPSYAGKAEYKSAARYFVPIGEVVFERTERVSPTARMRSYVGMLNSVALGPYAQGTLLCRAPQTSGNNQDGYRCVYSFDWDSFGWKHQDEWRNEQGQVPIDSTLQEWDVIPQVDFTPLGFDWSD